MSHSWVVSSCKPAKHTSKEIVLDLNIFNFNCTLNSVTGSGHVKYKKALRHVQYLRTQVMYFQKIM